MRRALCLSALLVSLSCQADVYIWTDADGHKHFSDRIPPGQEGKARHQDAAGAQHMQTDSEAQDVRDRQAAAAAKVRDDQESQATTDADAESAERDRENLCRALHNRENFIQSGRIFSTDSSGQTHYYSDAEIAEQRQTIEQQLQANNCN